jgi:hypothetical protein
VAHRHAWAKGDPVRYAARSRALDDEILGVIEAWHRRGDVLSDGRFNELALRLFEYQLHYNEAYARYCAALGVASPLQSWQEIPGVPTAAFKEAALSTFDPSAAALVFETSGTTGAASGRHYMETPVLYDAAVLAGFDRYVLGDGKRLRFLSLVTSPAQNGRSSLGYMVERVARERGDGLTGWYVHRNDLLVERFVADAGIAIDAQQPVCLCATAFALVHLLEAMEQSGSRLAFPPGSRVMETGGIKGRARLVERDRLYEGIADRLGIPAESIIGEYGMTELTSQYYDAAPPSRHKAGPPWLRTRVVGPQRTTLPPDEIGALLHVDLANRSSCIAIQTDDLGVSTACGIVLIGRKPEVAPRGCSLDAEELQARTSRETPKRTARDGEHTDDRRGVTHA